MKKLISLVLALIFISTLFTFTTVGVSAENDDIKIRVSVINLNQDVTEIGSYTSLKDGWVAAITLAKDKDKLKENDNIFVIVDFYADWIAKDGDFSGQGTGFYDGALYIPEWANVIINLNGHKLDRNLDDYKYNGEVLCVDHHANVIVNGGSDQSDPTIGTITGGFSCNGGGGIHIHDNGHVLLNYVSVSGNRTEDDDGAGIALYNDATLAVNGGEISNNTTRISTGALVASFFGLTNEVNYGAGVYVKDASAVFNNVTFTGNMGKNGDDYETVDGDVIAARNSTVTMSRCKIYENSIRDKENTRHSNVFYLHDSNLIIDNCDIYSNASSNCYLFNAITSTLEIKSSRLYNNGALYLFRLDTSTLKMYKSDIHNNEGGIIITIEKCAGEIYTSKFTNNKTGNYSNVYDFRFRDRLENFVFAECEFGDSTYLNKEYAQFTTPTTASIFSGSGSLSMIISMVSLAVAIAAIALVWSNTKKKKKD